MPCAVPVLPNVVRSVLGEGIDPLVEIGAPAVAGKGGVAVLVVGVIDMGNGYRHPISGKPEAVGGPHQVAGIVIDLACARRSG